MRIFWAHDEYTGLLLSRSSTLGGEDLALSGCNYKDSDHVENDSLQLGTTSSFIQKINYSLTRDHSWMSVESCHLTKKSYTILVGGHS